MSKTDILKAEQLVVAGFDETNIATGATNTAMSGLGASTEGQPIPFPFSIVGISVRSNADVTQGSIAVEAMLDGAATGLIATLDTTNVRVHSATQARGLDAVGRGGGRVGARYTTTNLLPTGSAEIEVFVYVLAELAEIN